MIFLRILYTHYTPKTGLIWWIVDMQWRMTLVTHNSAGDWLHTVEGIGSDVMWLLIHTQ